MTNTTQVLAVDTSPQIDPIKNVSDLGDELDFEMAVPTTIAIEESEDWDRPDFSATNLDMEIAKFMTTNVQAVIEEPPMEVTKLMTKNVQAVIEEPPAVVYLSSARGQSTRECRISGICE
ncbi:hypothetical protein [Microcoleus sp. LEGE 07076]|uniref:hypothetical protein n=1 Tax=Microcoleus sp. LEGE 07076 TaxID=915322 RepID=UPI001D13A8FA|nr:hypothetical protein [Microcoleus sp. LEGE 07076]